MVRKLVITYSFCCCDLVSISTSQGTIPFEILCRYKALFEIFHCRLIPLNECADGVTCPEELHALNRRTTFSIISEDYVPKEAPKLPDAGKKVAPKAATPKAIAPAASPAKAAAVAPATTAPAAATPVVAPVVAPVVTPAKAPATAVPVRKKP